MWHACNSFYPSPSKQAQEAILLNCSLNCMKEAPVWITDESLAPSLNHSWVTITHLKSQLQHWLSWDYSRSSSVAAGNYRDWILISAITISGHTHTRSFLSSSRLRLYTSGSWSVVHGPLQISNTVNAYVNRHLQGRSHHLFCHQSSATPLTPLKYCVSLSQGTDLSLFVRQMEYPSCNNSPIKVLLFI
jgi:hypothetical protein